MGPDEEKKEKFEFPKQLFAYEELDGEQKGCGYAIYESNLESALKTGDDFIEIAEYKLVRRFVAKKTSHIRIKTKPLKA